MSHENWQSIMIMIMMLLIIAVLLLTVGWFQLRMIKLINKRLNRLEGYPVRPPVKEMVKDDHVHGLRTEADQ